MKESSRKCKKNLLRGCKKKRVTDKENLLTKKFLLRTS